MSSGNPLYYIKTKNSLRKIEKIHTIKQHIVNKIQQDIDVSKLRDSMHINNELILFVCSCVEELCKSKYKIDKKEFVVEILNVVFGNLLIPNEINQIKQQIDFAYENDLIKKVDISYKSKVILWNWVCRKFL